MFSRKRWKEDGQIIPHYYGPLSSFPEWHSLGIGFYHGLSEDRGIPRRVLTGNKDVRKEPHMAKSIGFPLGVLSKYAFIGGGSIALANPLLQTLVISCL